MADYEIQGVSMTMTLASGTVLSLDEDDIMLGSVTLDDSSSTATDFQLGTAIAKKLSFELNNFDDRFSDYDFVGAVVSASLSYTVGNILASADATVDNNLLELPNAHVDSENLLGSTAATEPNGNTVTMENGIVTDTGASLDANGILTFGDGTLSNRDIIGVNGGTVTAPVGVFYVVEKPVYNGGTIAFTAFDCICLTDRVWETSLTFPTTLQMIYNEICEYCDVPHLSAIIPNGGYVVKEKPAETTITCADMLCYISQLGGGFAHTDADGNLCIMQYGGVLHSIPQSYTSEIDTDDIIITGVSAIECFDETDDAQPGYYVAGSAGYVLAIAENPLVQQGDAQKAATFVNSVVHGMKFRPMHLTVPKDPTIHAGDAFIFTDRKGNQYGGYATTVSFNTNDVTTVAMDAKSPTEHNSVNYSSTTKTMSEVRRLTGTDAIFSKVYARGIIADYIIAGLLKSAVSGFSLNLDTGAANLSNVNITGGALNINDAFKVTTGGAMTATGATISGNVTATTGLLGGWTIAGNGITKTITAGGVSYRVTISAPTAVSTPFLTCQMLSGGTWSDMLRIYPEGQAIFGNASLNGTLSVDPNLGLVLEKTGYGSVNVSLGDENYTVVVQDSSGNRSTLTPTTVVTRNNEYTKYATLGANGFLTVNDGSYSGTLTGTKVYNLNRPSTGGGTATSVATSTWVTVAQVAHGIGTFLIIGFATFPSNATGRRTIRVTTSASSSTAFHNMAQCNQTAVNGESTQTHISMVYTATSSGTWYLRAWQNAGSALSTTGYIQIVQLG